MKKLSEFIVIKDCRSPYEKIVVDFTSCAMGDWIDIDVDNLLNWISQNYSRIVDPNKLIEFIVNAFNHRAGVIGAQMIEADDIKKLPFLVFKPAEKEYNTDVIPGSLKLNVTEMTEEQVKEFIKEWDKASGIIVYKPKYDVYLENRDGKLIVHCPGDVIATGESTEAEKSGLIEFKAFSNVNHIKLNI